VPISERSAIVTATRASSVERGERVQSLWGGYGEVVRYSLEGADRSTVVVKHVLPGPGLGIGHARKLRSYDVEQAFYTEQAIRCGPRCRVAQCLHAEHADGEWLFVLEDLDAAGFGGRSRRPSEDQRNRCLRWLAAFHATFLGVEPRGLWPVGTYWHLGTRPDELRAMPPGALRRSAAAIDSRLSAARFQTLVHGDAKPANFCFSGAGVAAVDFQYVGGGVGVKDVAYLLDNEDRGETVRALDIYFDALRDELSGRHVDVDALEAEWRDLYPFAWADFERFVAGWSPGWRTPSHGAALTKLALSRAGR
jgi:hypothetical protein